MVAAKVQPCQSVQGAASKAQDRAPSLTGTPTAQNPLRIPGSLREADHTKVTDVAGKRRGDRALPAQLAEL